MRTTLILFLLAVALDFIYTAWTVAVLKRRAMLASFHAMACYLLTAALTIEYVSNPWNLVAITCGVAVGTYAAVKWHS